MTLQKGLFALHEFTNNLDQDIKVYLNDLVITLLAYLKSTSYSRDVKYWALNALGSVESSAQAKILPFLNPIIEALLEIVNNTQMSQ